jgi:2-C-methyl-D-erythritol 4-phosphate cytidylyltransferase
VWAAQTPQVFKRDLIMRAYQKYGKQKVTDDAMLVEKMGKPVKMLMGSYLNLKITTPDDLLLAEAVLGKKTDKLRRK